MKPEICECGHEECLHGFEKRPCIVFGCPCKKFKAQEKDPVIEGMINVAVHREAKASIELDGGTHTFDAASIPEGKYILDDEGTTMEIKKPQNDGITNYDKKNVKYQNYSPQDLKNQKLGRGGEEDKEPQSVRAVNHKVDTEKVTTSGSVNQEPLSDLRTEIYGLGHEKAEPKVKVSDLKAEAIKWVKEDIKDYRENVQVPGNIEINSYTMFVIKKWMKRLNITEEDLI